MVKRIDKRYRITFFSSLIVGILSQGMGLFNKFSIRDDVCSLFKIGYTVTSGRWALQLLGDLEKKVYGGFGHYSMPLFNGALTILFIAIASVFIVRLLDIESDLAGIFIGGLMVAFPTVTCAFDYMFTAHYYFFAMMCSVFGAVLICSGDKLWKAAVGIILIAFSMGVYQGFLPTSITLMLCYVIRVITEEKPLSSILKRILRIAAGCVLAVLLYYALTQLSLIITHTQLTEYEGISSMGKGSLSEFASRIKMAYHEFFWPTHGSRDMMYPYHLYHLYMGTTICLAAIYLVTVVKLFRKRGSLAVLYTVSGIAFPLAVNFIFVMVSVSKYSLMVYSQTFPFIALIWHIDRLSGKKNEKTVKHRKQKVIGILAFLYCMLVLAMYIRYDNACYLKTAIVQEEAKSYLTTLVTRIKSVPGYKDEYSVTFINKGKNRDKTITKIEEFDDLNLAGSRRLRTAVKDYASRNFINMWCGFSPKWADSRLFYDLPEVQEMTHYPDDGSIKVINQTVVVKF